MNRRNFLKALALSPVALTPTDTPKKSITCMTLPHFPRNPAVGDTWSEASGTYYISWVYTNYPRGWVGTSKTHFNTMEI